MIDINKGKFTIQKQTLNSTCKLSHTTTHRFSKFRLPGIICMASHSIVHAYDDNTNVMRMASVGVSQPAC